MKIKIFELDNKIVDIKEVNVYGDSLGFDIFYKYDNKYYHDICVEELEENEKLNNTLKKIKELTKTEYIKFDIDIRLDLELNDLLL